MSSLDETFLVDPSAGLDSLATHPSRVAFWAHVRAQLAALPRRVGSRITTVQLAGDCTAEPKFKDALRDALAEVAPWWKWSSGRGKGEEGEWTPDPVFGAAIGAALYARRRQEVPFRCVEREHCEEERQRQRDREDVEPGEL